MNKKVIIFLILLLSSSFSEKRSFGFGFNLNTIYANAMFFPVPSMSLYIMNSPSSQILEIEYAKLGTFSETPEGYLLSGERNFDLALTYSYLRNISKHLSIGPTIAIQLTNHQAYPPGLSIEDNKGYISKEGIYFLGLKGIIILKKNHFGITLNERLLCGLSIVESTEKLGVSNSLGLGLFYCF
jgi:hypothetical protein